MKTQGLFIQSPPELIKSVSSYNEEILNNIIRLYIKSGRFEVDPTYSTGGFYGSSVPQPIHKLDISPKVEGVTQADCRYLPFAEGSIESVIFDPPFMFGDHGNQQTTYMKSCGKSFERFGIFKSLDDLSQMYRGSLLEFHRILRPGGILIFKCQDFTDSKTNMTHCSVYNWAVELGFYAEDIFILVKKSRPIFGAKKRQKHSRKFHSYYWVFRKLSNKAL